MCYCFTSAETDKLKSWKVFSNLKTQKGTLIYIYFLLYREAIYHSTIIIVLYSALKYCIVLHIFALHCFILYCVVLHCIILYCSEVRK